MVAKKGVEWQNVEPPWTPSKVREFIESCKDWLLEAVPEEEDTELPSHALDTAVESQMTANIAVVREHIYVENAFLCFMCRTSTSVQSGHIVNANPFTRAQCMLVCETCFRE